MRGDGKEKIAQRVKLIEEERKKKTAETTIGPWNVQEPSLVTSVYEAIEKEMKIMSDLLWKIETVLILKERNYLAVDSQRTNRTGIIHLTCLLLLVSKHRYYCTYIVKCYQATSLTI